MCGFAGFLTSNLSGGADLRHQVERMASELVHRGPDDSGTWADDQAGIALGFRRLSIIDLSDAGHQPMISPSGRFSLVYNGEVYNDSALRAELEAEGCRFRGHSDTEVILSAFEHWGVRSAVERFIGMFAFALWDAEARTLTLGRDRLGIKPLFVHAHGGLISFASEMKALHVGPSFDTQVSREAVDSYLRHLYVPAPLTIFRHTLKLRPGHILTVSDAGAPLPESEPYWSLHDVARAGAAARARPNLQQATEELDALLLDAVRLRMHSDVPLGALLSGGIDSSTVVSMMQEVSDRPVRTFCIGFDGGEHDESRHAQEVADHIGTDHTSLNVSGEDALELIPRIPDLFDEPLADPSQIPTWIVCELARRDVTVALSGDGGDELFAGYNRYIDGVSAIDRAGRIPAALRAAVGRGIGAVPSARWDQLYGVMEPALPSSVKRRLPGAKFAKLGALFRQDSPEDMYLSLVSAWQHPDALTGQTSSRAGTVREVVGAPAPSRLAERMALADQLEYLPDDLLAKVDRASMANGLEVRVPILDHRIVEYSWTLPLELKVRDGVGKRVLREVLYRRVPRHLVERPKVGFSVPIAAWLRGPLRDWAEDLLTVERIERHGLVLAAPVRDAWERFLNGSGELALGIWAVVVLQAWADRWLP